MDTGKKNHPQHPRSMPVIVNGIFYPSLRQAAKGLHVSQGALLNYLNKRVRRSVLRGVEIRLVTNAC